MAIPTKPRVKGSKNRKKSWNKCDISEVEEYLEDQRFNERIGGDVSDKTDADLFILQTTTDDPPDIVSKGKFSLKCHSNIGAFSQVAAPVVIHDQPYSKRIKTKILNADKKRQKRALARAGKKKKRLEKKVVQSGFFVSELKDLWGEEEKIDPEIKDLVLFRDEITRKRPPKVPFHRYQQPSLLPAVEIPHPGASYNPAYEDHQALLFAANQIEEKKEKEELHLKRVLTDMFPTREEAPTAESILKEMSQGLFDDDEEEENETEKPLTRYRNPPVTPDDRIPKARKRRKKERKEVERLKKVEKVRRMQLNQIYRIKSIKGEIKKEDIVSQKRQEKKDQHKIDRMYQPHTLSKHKYEAPDVELALPEELCESLRTLKSEGNLLEDRYKSLQRRNIIEPRIPTKRNRKYKLKIQVKRGHRNFK